MEINFLNKFYEYHASFSSPLSIKFVTEDIDRLLESYDALTVTTEQIQQWLLSFKGQWKRSESFNRRIRNFKKLFDYLVEQGYRQDNPMDTINIQKTKYRSLALSSDKLRRIIDYAEYKLELETGINLEYKSANPTRDKAIFFTLLTSGMYLAELCKIKRSNLKIKTKEILIPAEDCSHRKRQKIVPFGKKAQMYIERYLQEDLSPHPTLLFHRDNGEPFNIRILYHLIRAIIFGAFTRQEVQYSRGWGWQVLRHTFIALYIENGGSCDGLEQMNYSQIEITQYAKTRKRLKTLRYEFRTVNRELASRFGL